MSSNENPDLSQASYSVDLPETQDFPPMSALTKPTQDVAMLDHNPHSQFLLPEDDRKPAAKEEVSPEKNQVTPEKSSEEVLDQKPAAKDLDGSSPTVEPQPSQEGVKSKLARLANIGFPPTRILNPYAKKPDPEDPPIVVRNTNLVPAGVPPAPKRHKRDAWYHDSDDDTIWHTTSNALQGPPTQATIRDLKKRELALIRAEKTLYQELAKKQEEKRAEKTAADRARRNAKGRLKTDFSLSLESPTDNRAANREVGSMLREYIKRCAAQADDDEQNLDPLQYRDWEFLDKVLPTFCDQIELPCFRVSTLTPETLTECFPVCKEDTALADFARSFMDNLGNAYAFFLVPNEESETFYYITRWDHWEHRLRDD